MKKTNQTYNIPDFLAYLNIGGIKNEAIHVAHYDEQSKVRLQSKAVTIDFYYLSIKESDSIKKPKDNMSNCYLFLDCPGNELEWDYTLPAFGYSMFVSAKLLDKYAKEYNFMHYNNHEALYLTKEEKGTLLDLFKKAYSEFRKEEFSKEVLVSYSALILSYTQSFYKRQFESRSKIYNKVVSDFYAQLEGYFSKGKDVKELPSVNYFAQKANLSPNYFGDLIKHFTGTSPQEHIHQYIIQQAKHKLRQSTLSISEIGYSLGFDYPTYFTRFFRKETGITPNVFRNQ